LVRGELIGSSFFVKWSPAEATIGTRSAVSSGFAAETSSASVVIHCSLMVPEPNCWKATRMVPGSVLRPPQPASAVSGSTVATPALSRRKVRRSGADRVTGSRATKTSSSTSGADVDNSPCGADLPTVRSARRGGIRRSGPRPGAPDPLDPLRVGVSGAGRHTGELEPALCVGQQPHVVPGDLQIGRLPEGERDLGAAAEGDQHQAAQARERVGAGP